LENLVSQSVLSTPVLIIAYRRKDTTRKVLEAVRAARPKRIYVACNAPRPDQPLEAVECAAVRNLFNEIDWPCEIQRLFRTEHLRARESISSAITWFFNHELKGIILEDDCVPSSSFFQFCDELLDRYENDQRVGMISGNNFQFGKRRGEASYYFSRYCHIWGWATWRDRWTVYDPGMHLWPKCREQVLIEMNNPLQRIYWAKIFDRTYGGKIDTWDYQWLFSNWINHRVSVMPQVNMVSNIGFGEQAHHTRNVTRAANIPQLEMAFPLLHPSTFLPHKGADSYTFFSHYLPRIPAIVRFILKKFKIKVVSP